jgi:hypothetical protein
LKALKATIVDGVFGRLGRSSGLTGSTGYAPNRPVKTRRSPAGVGGSLWVRKYGTDDVAGGGMPIKVHKVADIVDRAVVFCGTWKSGNGDAVAIINCQPAADPISAICLED